MQIRPRSDWEAVGERITGPSPRPDSEIGRWIIHYAGAGSTPTTQGAPNYLRGQQHYHLSQHGYSISYNFGITADGSIWELRGDDIRNAANNGKKEPEHNCNAITQSVLCMTGSAAQWPAPGVAALNWLLSRKPARDIQCHHDVEWTACPGAGITEQIRSGAINSAPIPEPEPDPPGGEHMNPILWTHKDHPGTFLLGQGPALYCTPEIAKRARAAGIEKVTESGATATTALEAYRKQAGI